jgi:uncharacterized protein (DUF305 family)
MYDFQARDMTRNIKTAILTGVFLLGAVAAPLAQDAHSGHDMSATGDEVASGLPDICKAAGEATVEPMASGHEMDQAHTDLMAGMDAMNRDMMTGAMAEDIDVAFVCGMIPHHQGAIDMAKAELAHGDDEWAKQMAQKVIDAQEAEIADMLAWLEEQAAQ